PTTCNRLDVKRRAHKKKDVGKRPILRKMFFVLSAQIRTQCKISFTYELPTVYSFSLSFFTSKLRRRASKAFAILLIDGVSNKVSKNANCLQRLLLMCGEFPQSQVGPAALSAEWSK